MKNLIFTIWIILFAVSFNINYHVIAQNQWFFQNYALNHILEEVRFIDENTGWAAGRYTVGMGWGMLSKTTNGGKNWISHYPTSDPLYSVYLFDGNTGWVVGGNGNWENQIAIEKTTNGGSWWNSQGSYISAVGPLRSVYFTDINTGWAVGDNDLIIKTTNSGNNWTSITSGISSSFLSVYFKDALTGWVAGTGGKIIKTTNGGNNWISQIIGTNLNLSEIRFIESNTGFVVGNSGAIFTTTNGGNNWINRSTGTTNYMSVHFININTGWISRSGGTILQTINGGLNWSSQISGTTDALHSIYFTNASRGWAVGDNWTILSTFNLSDSNDVGVKSIIEPYVDSAYYVDCINNRFIVPKITLNNSGIKDQDIFFDVHFEIKQGDNILYSSMKQDTISSGQTHTLNFDPYTIAFDFSAYNVNLKSYSVKSWTSLLTDTNYANDTVSSVFTVNNPNYGYSDISGYYFLNSSANASCIPDQPVFHWEDTTGSFNLITNGTIVVPYTEYNSFYFSGCYRLPDVLPDGNKFKFFGTCYDTIVIATNGIIGLGGSMTGMNIPLPVSIPSASAPKPAIFPFWYWCNFLDPEITGRNLKYKVTADKFIVTYDRVPIYNTIINSQDYLSYQVILEIGPGCGIDNGKITVQFDDSKSGSYFLNNYYNGNLNANTVGIQDASGTIGIQYRRSNSPGNIPVPGPLFGSPMAIAFGQTNELLPVELASFNSFVNENNVTLNWQTNSETNNSGFNIERSSVKDQWSNMGFIKGSGNTNSATEYAFTDKDLVPGKYNYRLKQIDYNGSFEYFDLTSEVIIGVPEKYELLQNYPNPFNPVTNLEFGIPELGFVTLKVYDVLGKEVKTLVNEIKPAGRYRIEFDGSGFASGVYFYELRAGNFVSQKRMLFLK